MMMAELMSLWKMVPMAMGYAAIFFGYGNQPCTKEVRSEVFWDELVIGSYPLAQFADGIDSLYVHLFDDVCPPSECVCCSLQLCTPDTPPEVCRSEGCMG